MLNSPGFPFTRHTVPVLHQVALHNELGGSEKSQSPAGGHRALMPGECGQAIARTPTNQYASPSPSSSIRSFWPTIGVPHTERTAGWVARPRLTSIATPGDSTCVCNAREQRIAIEAIMQSTPDSAARPEAAPSLPGNLARWKVNFKFPAKTHTHRRGRGRSLDRSIASDAINGHRERRCRRNSEGAPTDSPYIRPSSLHVRTLERGGDFERQRSDEPPIQFVNNRLRLSLVRSR